MIFMNFHVFKKKFLTIILFMIRSHISNKNMSGGNYSVLLQKIKERALVEKLKKCSIQSGTTHNETHNDETSFFKVPLSPPQWSFHNISNPVLLQKCDSYRKYFNWAHEKLNVGTLAALYSDLTEVVFTYL
ncbi:uncharacterized protein LOC142327027 isoform X1 [Lycorma delicatula]|uniref:uncharacterized protein LOC142327027 isoform X1 n=1 Tax=Lycorma delicatula TaxID=130591 RepID=UPI003F51028B